MCGLKSFSCDERLQCLFCFAVNLDNSSSALTLAKHSIKKRSSSGNWQKYNILSRVFNVYLHNYCLDLNVSWYIFGGLGCLTEFQPYKPKPELQLKTNCCLICCILPAFLRFLHILRSSDNQQHNFDQDYENNLS